MPGDVKYILGQVPEFNPQLNSWPATKKKLNNFLTLNEITEEPRKRAILLNSLNEEAYLLIANLCMPAEPEEKSFATLLQVLDTHFTPARSGFAEREKFYGAKKEVQESLADWAARVRSLATYCKFGNHLETCLRDQFIMGIEPGPVRDRIFTEDVETLTSSRALELAQSMEAVQQHRSAPDPGRAYIKTEQVDLNKYETHHKGKKYPCTKTQKYVENKCSVCGYKNHTTAECKYKNCKCDECGQKGHIRSNCKNKKTRKNSGRFVQNKLELESNMEELKLFSIQASELEVNKPFTVEIKLEKVPIVCEIDSGAAVTVISQELFEKHFNAYPLHKCEVTLVNYIGTKIKPLGLCKLKVTYKNIIRSLNILIIQNGGPPLLGRDWMNKFNFSVQCVKQITHAVDSETNKLISHYSLVFSDRLGTFNRDKMKLHLKKSAVPKSVKPRPLPFKLVDKVNQELDRLLKLDIITPIEYSEWATPIVPVIKSDGSVRLCGDYKITLNPWLKVDKYPLHRIEELFTHLRGGVEFTKLDMSNAYQQILLDEKSKLLTTISTHRGLFVYNRIPFGISPAPAKSQSIIDTLLLGIPGVVAFLDDILITGSNRAEHLQRLCQVMDRLQNSGLTLRTDKCNFFMKSVTYLGHRIDKNGLRTNPDTVKAIENAPSPGDVDQLRSFLGMVNFYRRFIKNAAQILSPLTNLLKHNVPWKWSDDCIIAFNKVKKILVSDNILCHYDPNMPVKLTVDASPYGLGAVITHVFKKGVERPISCISRTLTKSEKNYSQLHKEALAIIYGVKSFYQYLYGRKFLLSTDHKPLLAIFGPKVGIPQMAASRLQRYAVFLSAFSYEIEYVKSEKNIADCFSRLPINSEGEIENIEEYANLNYFKNCKEVNINFEKIKECTSLDKILIKICKYLKEGWPKKVDDKLKPYFLKRNELSLEENCVMRGYKLVIPQELQREILTLLHSSHSGIVKMKSIARSYFWWPNIDKQIEDLCKSCSSCLAGKPAPEKSPLISWNWPTEPWQRIHVDFFGPIFGSNFFVWMDAHSKWIEIFKMSSTNVEAMLTVIRTICARFGLPVVLVSDNGPQFTSNEFKNFCNDNGIKHVTCAPYHPASNGAGENVVKTAKAALLAAYRENNKININCVLEKFLFDYRTSVHCTTGVSPAELMFGRKLRARFDLINPFSIKKTKKIDCKKFVEIQQSKQKKYFKGNRRVKLPVGKNVFVRDYRQVNHKNWIFGKISKILNSREYEVYIPALNVVWRRHINQINHSVSDGLAINDTLLPAPEKKNNNDCFNDQSSVNIKSPENRVVRSERVRRPPERYKP